MKKKDARIIHKVEDSRFEIIIAGEVATVLYEKKDNLLYLLHAEVPHCLRGRGIGKVLVNKTLDYIEENQLEVVPICSFIKRVVQNRNN